MITPRDPLQATAVKSKRIVSGTPVNTSEPVWVKHHSEHLHVKKETERADPFALARKLTTEKTAERIAAIEEARNEGFREGYATAEEEWRNRFEQMAKQLESYAQEIDRRLSQIPSEWVDPTLDLTLEIAKKAIGTELQITSAPIECLVKSIANELESRNDLTITLNNEDCEALQQCGIDLRQSLATDSITVIGSSAIQRGGCLVKTPSGTIDARWETIWTELTSALLPDRIKPIEQQVNDN